MFHFRKTWMNCLNSAHTQTHADAHVYMCIFIFIFICISTHPCDDVHIKRLEKLIESFNGGDLLPAILASDHSYMFASVSIAITRFVYVIWIYTYIYTYVHICMHLYDPKYSVRFYIVPKQATADCGPQPVRIAATGNIYASPPTSDQRWTWIYMYVFICAYMYVPRTICVQATLSFRTRLRKVPPNRGRKWAWALRVCRIWKAAAARDHDLI